MCQNGILAHPLLIFFAKNKVKFVCCCLVNHGLFVGIYFFQQRLQEFIGGYRIAEIVC